MDIWIVFAGETLPMDDATRQWRYGMLAETLIEREHKVIRWAPTFNHSDKKQRYNTDHTYKVNENYKIELLYNRGYKSNIGFQRLLSYIQLAHSFKRRIKKEKPPDIIISGLPTPWLCSVAIIYGQQKNIPALIDIRDLWPDIFLEVFPWKLQWLAELVMLPLFKKNYYIFQNASGITAISSNYLKWGLAYSGRNKRNTDGVFYMGYPKKNLSDSEKKKSGKRWTEIGVRKDTFLCCFFGSINNQFDLDAIISAAKILEASAGKDIQFVVCGDGVKLNYYKEMAIGMKNIIFPGWVSQSDIRTLIEWSMLGFAPYQISHHISDKFHIVSYPLSTIGDKSTLSNKIFEYFCGGLPVITSLHGELEQILSENDCGLTYEAGDVQGLVNAILNLKDNPGKRVQMGKNARRLFEKKYSSDKIYPAMADHIEGIVNRGNSKRAG